MANDERHNGYSFIRPSQVLREVVGGGLALAGQAVRSLFVSDAPSAKAKVVFFLPGLLGFDALYWGVCRQLEHRMKGKVRYHIPEIGYGIPIPKYGWRLPNINCRPYGEVLERLEREYEVLRPVAVVGHSLGGAYAFALHAKHPEVSPCAIGSPIWGTPSLVLSVIAHLFPRINQGNIPPQLAELRDHVVHSPSGATTVSSKDDPIAPPEQCQIAGANNLTSKGGHVEIVCHEETYEHVTRHNRRALVPLRAVPRMAAAANAV